MQPNSCINYLFKRVGLQKCMEEETELKSHEQDKHRKLHNL